MGSLTDLTESWMEKWKQDWGWMEKPVLLLFSAYGLALLALIRANCTYVDDLSRSIIGYHGWWDWSRYVTEVLSCLVHMEPRVLDISPIPQLLAAFLMAVAGVVVIYSFTAKKEIRLPMLAATLPMGLSPWFLECFSFKFDAPYMALSVLASVLPFLWWGKEQKKFYVASFLCVLVMTMTYQASSGIFVIETLFLAFLDWLRGESLKKLFHWIIRSGVVYVAALLLFRIALMRTPTEEELNYVSVGMLSLQDGPTVLWKHMQVYLLTALGDLSLVGKGLCFAAVVDFLLHAWNFTQRNRWFTMGMLLPFLLLCAILSDGVYLLLKQPLFYPRGMLGMGIFVSFALISYLCVAGKKMIPSVLVCLIAWHLVTLTAAYGNALADQKRYTDFRVQLVVQDLNRLELNQEQGKTRIHLAGDIGKSQVACSVGEEYPAVKRLIYSTFSNDRNFGCYYFFFYHNLEYSGVHEDPAPYMELPVVLENQYHKIQTDGKEVLVTLKECNWKESLYLILYNRRK